GRSSNIISNVRRETPELHRSPPTALTLFAPNPRARGARRASDVGPRSDPHSGGQQRDPRSGRPARAGWAALRQFRFWGERWSSGVRGAGRAQGGTGYRQTGGTERSALSLLAFLLFIH